MMKSKIAELRRVRDYSGSRLNRARRLYVRLRRDSIKPGDVPSVLAILDEMRNSGLYSITKTDNDGYHSVLRHCWKLDLKQPLPPHMTWWTWLADNNFEPRCTKREIKEHRIHVS